MKIDEVYSYAAAEERMIAAGVGRVPAGFPSPSQDYSDTKIDLTQMLIRDELSTFIVRVSGDSMEGAGIYDGDKLIVDRSIEPRDGHVVIAIVDGESKINVKRSARYNASRRGTGKPGCRARIWRAGGRWLGVGLVC